MKLGSLGGKTLRMATVPSIDTPVCNAEKKKYNEQAESLANTHVLVVSTDLPFGQKRWCGTESVEDVVTLSAHRTSEFGESYGVLISGGPFAQCLSRAIFVCFDAGIFTQVPSGNAVAHRPAYTPVMTAA